MTAKGIDDLRTSWGPTLESLIVADSEHVRITRTLGRPRETSAGNEAVAVLVPWTWYEALPEDLLPDDTQRQDRTSSIARDQLSAILDAALAGIHTVVIKSGKPRAVFVPRAWYESAQSGSADLT